MVKRLTQDPDYKLSELSNEMLYNELIEAAGSEKHAAYYRALSAELDKRIMQQSEGTIDANDLFRPSKDLFSESPQEREMDATERAFAELFQ